MILLVPKAKRKTLEPHLNARKLKYNGMKKLIYLSFLFFVACQSEVSKEDLKQLNGYWEIKTVVFPDGTTKEYKSSSTVDYFEIENLKGFRKKVQPKLNGTYDTSNDAELFTIVKKERGFQMVYKNELSEWSETLLSLHETSFSVVNKEGVRYDYNRFEPIELPPK